MNQVQKLFVGQIVEYTISEYEANRIRQKVWDDVGNLPNAGDVYPLMIVRIWPDSTVNGQLFYDGPDSIWLTSVVVDATSYHYATQHDLEEHIDNIYIHDSRYTDIEADQRIAIATTDLNKRVEALEKGKSIWSFLGFKRNRNVSD